MHFPSILIFITLVAAGIARGQRSYAVRTGGGVRQLELSTSEVAVKSAAGQRHIEAKTPARRANAGSELELVLIEERTRKDGSVGITQRHFVTREVLVKLKAGAGAKDLARQTGLRISHTPAHAPTFAIFDAGSSEAALTAMEALRSNPAVESADVVLATQKEKKFTPNDPLFSEQWHHRNTTQLGGALWIDTSITSVWDSFKGAGITIGIVDDGLEHTHPDLQPNYNTAIDFDFNSNDTDPTPVDLVVDSHGTACAGVAAARGSNGIGVSGAAPEATLAGFRLIAAANTDQNEADAFLINNDVIQVKSNSWGQPDGSGYGGPGPLALAALETAVTSGRGGKGVIQVFAGGNGLAEADNSNFDGYPASPFVIAVAAVNDFGFQSWYSEPGANLLISAPSSGGGHNEGIRTTDLVGENGDNKASVGTGDLADRNYTNSFGGTSSACPLVSGIVALILQANPNLGWRDVQEILIRTARKNHRADPDWATNAAGFSFNHKYGAGIIDAAAAVALAQQWVNLPAMITSQVAQTGIAASIPDNNATGITRTLNFNDTNFRVEHVTVSINATHLARGDLELTLTSPSGTVSKLAEMTPDGTDNLDWTFSSVHHWGESAAGNWNVKVADRVSTDTGTLNAVTIKLYGSTQATARIAATTATLTAEGNTPPNTAADPSEAVTFSIGLKNIGAVPTSSLTATLLPIGGVRPVSAVQNYGVLAAPGATVTRSFSFRLDGACGTAPPLIFQLQDGATDLGFASITIPLGTTTAASFSGGAITINDNAAASPSPSNLTVSGLVGRVQNITAQLNGLSHAYIDDVGALLRGPDQLKLRLFCGGTDSVTAAANITFDDNAALLFPGYGVTVTSAYRPWDFYGSSRTFTGDTAAETAYTLSEFRGVPANGTWKLFVQDFVAVDGGSLSSWGLNFTTVTCTDNILLTTAAVTGGEAAGTITVSVTRTGGLEGSASVNYATSHGTADANDYNSTSGTLTFAAGQLVQTFTISIINDIVLEPSETINITLATVTGSSTLGTLSTGTVTIEDNDTPTPVILSPATIALNEGPSALTFTVSRASVGSAGTVAYTTQIGTASAADFTPTSGTISFAAGDLSQTFIVQTLNDAMPESPETFTVTLQTPTGGLTLGSTTTSTITLTDADTDGDTMSDDYETSVGLSPAVNDAALDLDQDGTSNLDEFITATPPNQGSSHFRATSSFTGGDVGITFPSLLGRTYKVESTQTLVGPWSTLQSNIPGTAASITVTDPGASTRPRSFYRVIVTMP